MTDTLPRVHLKHPWRLNHPWIFQKLVQKPQERIKPGTIVEVVGADGQWIGRGFYNGHSRIALRILETRPEIQVDQAWFSAKIAHAVELRRQVLNLDSSSQAWRVIHSEGDDLSGLVVDRYNNLLIVVFFSAGMFRHREWIYSALRQQFTHCQIHPVADEHIQKQESFDLHRNPSAPIEIIEENGLLFRIDPTNAHKTGFFVDQRENRQWLSERVAGQDFLDLCCNTGGFSVYAAARGAKEVTGIDIDQDVIAIARANAKLNKINPQLIQADIFPWLRDLNARGKQYDVVVLDPAKMTRDRNEVIPALKKYLDMNKLAMTAVKSGGLFATFSCTGLISEEQFLDMLRRAAYFAGRTLQVLKVSGAGPDHPVAINVPESRYLKAVFARIGD